MEAKFIKSILNRNTYVNRKISKLKKDTSLKIFNMYANLSESYNDKVAEIPFNDKKIFYSYQRHDLNIICDDWIKFLYNQEGVKNNSVGIFFSSCMAAISTLFMVLKEHNVNSFLFSDLPYFEAYDFAEKMFGAENVIEYKNYNNKKVDVLWICTASPHFLSVDYKNIDSKYIVVDTSCIDCSNEYIKEIIEHCKDNNKQLFFVRSHMKLDCFGLEINRLGSLVSLNDKNNLISKCKEFEIIFGNNTNIRNIYPWLGEKDFFTLTSKNIKKVQNISLCISNILNKLLNKNIFEINRFDNNIYFTIKLIKKSSDLDKLNRNISSYCKQFNMPVSTAASFYLETVGIDNFVRRLDNNNQFLRISPSFHVSKKMSIEIAKTIAEYLNNNFF